MRPAFGHIVAVVIVAALAAGCNIFGTTEPTPGDEAPVLQDELDRFLKSGSTETITSDRLFLAAKESRQHAAIGVLTITHDLSQAPGTKNLRFPFETLSDNERRNLLPHLYTIEQALGLILFANTAGTRQRAAMMPRDDGWLRQAAMRVTIVGGIDPCGFYPDFLVARLLRVMAEFRIKLDAIDGGLYIVGLPGAYGIAWHDPAAANAATVAVLNAAIAALDTAVAHEVVPALDPSEMFDCPSSDNQTINADKVTRYIREVLLPSMGAYVVAPGDDDGDGRVDEEVINGRDDDGDGRIDEDAHL